MRLISPQEQQTIDRLWQTQTKLPLLLLMESAARAIADLCLALLQNERLCPLFKPVKALSQLAQQPEDFPLPAQGKVVLVLAGRGQNGGDAFACARMLAGQGVQVICRELFPDAPQPVEAQINRTALLRLGLTLGPVRKEDLTRLDLGLIVDGLFGTGYKNSRGLTEAFRPLASDIRQARQRGVRVLAIDVPSGLDCETGITAADALVADLTITFVLPKTALLAEPGYQQAGVVYLASLGIGADWTDRLLQSVTAPASYLIDNAMIRAIGQLVKRRPDAHKGSFGKALLVAGSPGMPGAAVLAAHAAARSGAGLVHVITGNQAGAQVIKDIPEALTQVYETLDGHALQCVIRKALATSKAAGIGPGLGQNPVLVDSIKLLIQEAPALLIDADALNLIASDRAAFLPLFLEREKAGLTPPVLTPHPGEFRRLAPQWSNLDRQTAARELAHEMRAIIVLKGSRTVIATPDKTIYLNQTGNHGLARGGSGDLLSGLITGLLAQGLQPVKAAIAGVYFHGLAADLAAGNSGRAMLPQDLLLYLAQAYSACSWD